MRQSRIMVSTADVDDRLDLACVHRCCSSLAWGLRPRPIRAASRPTRPRGGWSCPTGFHVEVFAAEPMVRQPLSASFDERGRLWVIEYLQYPNPAGLKPVTVDQYLRTEYDRVPEPPPARPAGCRPDQDPRGHRRRRPGRQGDGLRRGPEPRLRPGRRPRRRLRRPGALPALLSRPEPRRPARRRPRGPAHGLRPAGRPRDGQLADLGARRLALRRPGQHRHGADPRHRVPAGHLALSPAHEGVRALRRGGRQHLGARLRRRGQRLRQQQRRLHHLPHGPGRLLLSRASPSTARCTTPTPSATSARRLPGHQAAATSRPGGIIYKGDAFPPEFRGAFIGGNLLSNAVYWHALEARRARPSPARHGGTLIDARDTWFRPIDLLVGPDGCVYVVDWYDKRAAHLDPRDTWDRTNGRIYRVVYGERPQAPAVRPRQARRAPSWSPCGHSANDWFAREARRILAERRDPAVVPGSGRSLARRPGRDARPARPLGPVRQRRASTTRRPSACSTIRSPASERWTIRLLGDDRRMNDAPPLAARRARRATSPTPTVRSQLASSCQRWRRADALPILGRLARPRRGSRPTPHIPLLLWWAFERQLRDDRDGRRRLAARTRKPRGGRWFATCSSSARPACWPRRVRTPTSRPAPACWPPRPGRRKSSSSSAGWRRDSRAGGSTRARRALQAPLERLWRAISRRRPSG